MARLESFSRLISSSRDIDLPALLAAFSESERSRADAWLGEKGPVWLVDARETLESFRLRPAEGMAMVKDSIAEAHRRIGPGSTVLVVLRNRNNLGLDDYEAEAVFGRWLDVEFITQVDRGQAVSHLLLAGVMRTEMVGLSFHIDEDNVHAAAICLLAASFVPAIVFLPAALARRWKARWWSPGALALRLAAIAAGVSIGLWVPAGSEESALADLETEAGLVREFAGRAWRPIVRFERPQVAQNTQKLIAAMKKARLLMDSSLPMRTLSTSFATSLATGSSVDDTAYSRCGPYVPQLFDLRTPAAQSNGNDLVELASAKVDENGVAQLWRDLVEPDQQAIIRRLQFISMELYYLASTESVFLAQHYHEYRIFNWPKPALSPRITLLDAGSLENATRLGQTFRELKVIGGADDRSWRVVGGDELFTVAQSAARRRLASATEALRVQLDSHEYLKTVDVDGPLRQDHQRFVDFLPGSLGATLEIGSGYGQLARALVSRSESYVCVDLSVQALLAVRASTSASGVVADLHHLPLRESVFDSIIANNVLEHVYDPLASLTELRRVIKPGGGVFGLMPLDFLNADYDLRAHRWKADLRSFEAACAGSGFRLVRTEVLDLYALGVRGSFPSCNGRVLQFEAVRD